MRFFKSFLVCVSFVVCSNSFAMLNKAKVTKQGITANFWRPLTMSTDYISGETIVTVGLWTDKASFDAGNAPFETIRIMGNPGPDNYSDNATVVKIRNWVKNNDVYLSDAANED